MSDASVHSLPDDLVLKILCSVSRTAENAKDALSVLMTCKKWQRLCLSGDFLKDLSREALSVSVPQWENGARRFLQLAVDAGSLEATYVLGMILFYCFPSERTDGARLIVRAARSGHAAALYSTAVITFNGSGCSRQAKDLKMGVALCARAAALGNVEGLRELGHCLLDGFGVKQDPAEGWRLLLLAFFQELQANPNGNLSKFHSLACLTNLVSKSQRCGFNHLEASTNSRTDLVEDVPSVDTKTSCFHPNKKQRCSETKCLPLLSQSDPPTNSNLFGNSKVMPPQKQQAALQDLLDKRKATVLQPPPAPLDGKEHLSNAASERFWSGGIASSSLPRTPPSLGIGSDRRTRTALRPHCAHLGASVEETLMDPSLRVVRSSQGRLLLVNQRQVANVPGSTIQDSHPPMLPTESSSSGTNASRGIPASPTVQDRCLPDSDAAMDAIDRFTRSFTVLCNSFSSSSLGQAPTVPNPSTLEEAKMLPDEVVPMSQQILLYIIRTISSGLVPQPVNKKVKTVLSLLQTSCLSKPSHPVHEFLVEYKEKRRREEGNANAQNTPEVHFCGRRSCGRPETRPLEFWRCSCCWSARYCSRSCQLYDWRDRHSQDCKPSPHVRQQLHGM